MGGKVGRGRKRWGGKKGGEGVEGVRKRGMREGRRPGEEKDIRSR